MTILISAGILFILPFIFIGMLFINKFKSKLEWLLDVVVTFLLVSWLYQASAWSWIGYYFRFVMVGLLMIAIIYSWGKVRKLPFKIHEKKKISFIVNIILIFVFGLYNIFVLTSYSTNATKLELDFPMAEGTYFIGQGGDHVQMNYHQSYEPQQYALDIVALNTLGTRAKGFYPKDLDRYEIFGHAIVSPCAGVVTEMENGLPDLTPLKQILSMLQGIMLRLFVIMQQIRLCIWRICKKEVSWWKMGIRLRQVNCLVRSEIQETQVSHTCIFMQKKMG